MRLFFSSSLHKSVFQSIKLVKKSQPEIWDAYCKAVPMFAAVFRCTRSLSLATFFSHQKYKQTIISSKKLYAKYWEVYKDIILGRLQALFGYPLEEERKITVYVSLTPLYLRDIKGNYFLLPTGASKERILEIIIHELSHFYFYKCEDNSKDLYTDKDFWVLSEQVAPLIIDRLFCDIVKKAKSSYCGEPDARGKNLIEQWLNGDCSFGEMLVGIRSE